VKSGLITSGSLVAWSAIEQLAWPISQLVLTPILLHRLGPEQFGFWVLALTPLIGAATLSLGRSVSLLAVVPRLCARDEHAAVRPLVAGVLTLIGLISTSLLAVLFAAQHWFGPNLSASLDQPFLYVVLVLALVAATEVDSTISYTLKGLGKFKLPAQAELIARAMQLSVTTMAVGVGGTAVQVMAIALLAVMAKTLLKGSLLLRSLPTQAPGARMHSDASQSEIARTGLWNWLQVLSGVVFYSFDRWVVGALLGPAALGAYAICNQLAQLPHSIAAAGAQPLIPWASARADALASPQIAKKIGNAVLAATLAACSLPAIVAAAAPTILSLWISPAFAVQHGNTARGLGIVFTLLAANVPCFNLLIAWGQTRYAAILTAVAAAYFVAACFLFQPGRVADVVFLKLGYAVVGLAAVVKLVTYLRSRHRPST
jgi:O-antigen/teichoic acid export membrane protein